MNPVYWRRAPGWIRVPAVALDQGAGVRKGQSGADLGHDVLLSGQHAVEDGRADGEAPRAGFGESADLGLGDDRAGGDGGPVDDLRDGGGEFQRVNGGVAVGEQVDAVDAVSLESSAACAVISSMVPSSSLGCPATRPGKGANLMPVPASLSTASAANLPPTIQSTPAAMAASMEAISSALSTETTSR